MITRRNALTLAALPFGLAVSGIARAQSYPAKPIRFVVPFPAGGSTDVAARLIAECLTRAFAQQVYVENKSGANGTIGVEEAAKSGPDGYTILVTTDAVASNPHVYHTNIDPSQGPGADHPAVAPADRPRRSSLARRQFTRGIDCTGKAAAGPAIRNRKRVGSAQQMAVQWFAQIAGLKFEQVPYRGGGQAINDLLGGHVKLGSLGSTPLMPHYKAGTLRLLAQTTQARSPALPDVPTYQEAGIQGLVLDQWLGVFASARTSPDIIARLNAEIARRLQTHRCARACSTPRRSQSVDQPNNSHISSKTSTPNSGVW